jgi:hypothetical protein
MSGLHKRHFIALAEALRPVRKDLNETVLQALLAWCKAENRDFKLERFIEYLAGTCGPSGGRR